MAAIICENYYCVYWKENHCVLEDIELDRLGTCVVYQHVPVNPSIVERGRKKFIENWNRELEEDLRLDRELEVQAAREKDSDRNDKEDNTIIKVRIV